MMPIITSDVPEKYLKIRWCFEITLILLLSPVILLLIGICALFIVIESPGGVLFRQKRPGLNGVPFTIYKLRSMHVSENKSLAKENDPRITKTGRILRKYRLDELPQCWNILKKEMSLIGPRPVPGNYYSKYVNAIDNYSLRHTITPGVTGWAQVMQGYTSTEEEETIKFEHDLYYINHISAKTDLIIVGKTVLKLLSGNK